MHREHISNNDIPVEKLNERFVFQCGVNTDSGLTTKEAHFDGIDK